jgi:CheY-like chemotaxis protein
LRKTALVVDDSKTARNVLKKILETHDLEVATAESAEAAIDYLSDSRPDIIFMDHEMPGIDGLEAVSAIKDNPATATIPIMMPNRVRSTAGSTVRSGPGIIPVSKISIRIFAT